jgi:hypothetical protein
MTTQTELQTTLGKFLLKTFCTSFIFCNLSDGMAFFQYKRSTKHFVVSEFLRNVTESDNYLIVRGTLKHEFQVNFRYYKF